MKYVIIILLCFFSCKPKDVPSNSNVIPTENTIVKLEPQSIPSQVLVIRDTIYLPKKFDSLQVVIKKKNDSLFIERYKLERVRYYNKLAIRNKSQLKFLPGWINRATK